ncbi:MAG: histidinol-phosphate transaminase [Candidatus Marsarchaeota archaeon]
MAIHGADVWKDGQLMSVLDFSSNVNPLAPPKGLMGDLRRSVKLSKYYPEPDARSARSALATFHGQNIHPENVVVGNGANELIHLVFEAAKPGKALIIAPTYSEYEHAAIGHGHEPYFHVVSYPFRTNLEEISLEKGTSLVVICNPNNPTGELLRREDVLSFHDRVLRSGAVLMVDEVHMDLSDGEGESVIGDAAKREGLIVLRSLTKLLGVPGLRIGYSVSSIGWAKKMDSVRPSWNVNVLATELVKRWLDADFFKRSQSYAKKEREYLTRALASLGLEAIPSRADYLLVKLEGIRSWELKEELLKRGILIRDASSIRGLDENYVRIGTLSHKKNALLISALREILNQRPLSSASA